MSAVFGHAVRSIWEYRFALQNLILKDFRIRYRNMSLGMLWSILNPLVVLGVLTFVFTYIFPSQEKYFAVFVLLGLVPFNFFSLCLAASTPSIIENASLVKKVAFPRIVIPISVVLSQLIHVFIQVLLLGLFIWIFRVPVTPLISWLPVFYAIELVFILGVSLIGSTLCVFFRDTRYLVESGLAILFWFTPIFYSLGMIHGNVPRWVYGFYVLNPLAGCIEAARRVVIHGVAPDFVSLGIAAGVSVVTLVLGVIVFTAFERRFADGI